MEEEKKEDRTLTENKQEKRQGEKKRNAGPVKKRQKLQRYKTGVVRQLRKQR